MLKKELITTFLIVLAGSCLWAQSDFRKGYVITNQHDTIYGFIDYRGDIRNAKNCSFKKIDTDLVVDYTPMDILAYQFINSKLYLSRNVGSPDAPKYVFLECLVKGLVNLFYYRNDQRNDLYFIEKEGELYALEEFEQEVIIEKERKIRRLKPYVGILKSVFNVWEMNSEIESVKLEHNSLINIVMDYHKYVGADEFVVQKKRPFMAFRFGPVAGVDLSYITCMWIKDGRELKMEPSTNLTVGLNLNIGLPRINEKLFLQLQALYTKYYFFNAYESSSRAIDTHIKSDILQMGLSIKYEYPRGRWRPIFAGGISSIYLPNSSVKEIIYHLSSNGEVRPGTLDTDFPTKYMLGFGITPGIHYYLTKRQIIFVQAQYQYCSKKVFTIKQVNAIQSFGLSTGIYF